MADSGQVAKTQGGAPNGAGAAGIAQRALGMVGNLHGWFMGMAPQRRNLLVASLAMLAALGAGMLWYAGRPDWRVLFSGLDAKDVQQVSQELAAAGISYQMTADGTGLQVPADMLDKARMEVAAKGMPQSGRLGFELFDKPNWVGSEFDERVNYQRALEGELEHTIGTLDVVKSARVHLVLPQATLFSSQEKVAKASVVLKLKRSSLPVEQADSIRSLVAGAVENLATDQVTLVDADGRANLQARGRTAAKGDEEQALEAKLIAMLEPLAGAGNVRATVNVSFDEGTEERTDEVYDPAKSAPITVQKSEQMSGNVARPSGVPGTASNTPAASPEGAVQGSAAAAAPGVPPLLRKETLPVYPQSGGQTQNAKEESGTYAVSKHYVHAELGPGRVQRISAAVVVNDRFTTEGTGKQERTLWKPRSPEDMRRLEDLAKAAVGFDTTRGDQVVMQNISFSSNAPETKAAGFAKVMESAKGLLQPSMLRVAMLGVLGFMLVMFVLKPVANQVIATMREPALGSGSSSAAGGAFRASLGPGSEAMHAAANAHLAAGHAAHGADEAHRAAAGDGAKGDWAQPPRALEPVREEVPRFKPKTREAVFDHVSEHIRREPMQSTRLLETWIGSTEEAKS